MAPAVVWLVAAPNRRPPPSLATGATATSSYEVLKESLGSGGGVTAAVHRVHLPTLRVGTLDSLIAASDALARDEKTVDSVVERLLRQARELQEDEVRVARVGVRGEGGVGGGGVGVRVRQVRGRWRRWRGGGGGGRGWC